MTAARDESVTQTSSHATTESSPEHHHGSPRSDLRFRFKSRKRHRHEEDDKDHSSKRRRSRNRFSHHRSRRKSNDTPREHAPADGMRELSPDTAFRESLFDAMADDEGAEYWESVYGQPIHTYSNLHPALDPNSNEEDKMTEEEYVAHVRAKMWERTSEAAAEERERRLREKRAQAKKEHASKQAESEREEFARRMEESLKWGARRKRRRLDEEKWKTGWERYVASWEGIMAHPNTEHASVKSIPWPTRSGSRPDVSKDEVEEFFRRAAEHLASNDAEKKSSLRTVLKAERVRWHPDKMSQRFGAAGKLGTDTLESVTAVFQIIDGLFSSV